MLVLSAEWASLDGFVPAIWSARVSRRVETKQQTEGMGLPSGNQTWRAGKWMIFLARNLHLYGSFQPCLMKPEGKPKRMIPGWWTSKFLTLGSTGSTWTQRRCENVHRACTPPGPASSETSRRRRAVPSTGQPRRCWGYWGYHGIFFHRVMGKPNPKPWKIMFFFYWVNHQWINDFYGHFRVRKV